MTEAEWLACNDPQLMLDFFHRTTKAGERKLRLFAVACCRRLEIKLCEKWCDGILLAEQFAEGLARKRQLVATHRRLLTDFKTVIESDNGEIYAAKEAVLGTLHADSLIAARTASEGASRAVGCWHDEDEARLAEARMHAALLRDIFGNPFRPPTVDRSCLTPEIVALAEKAFVEMDSANRVGRFLELWWKQDYPEGQSGAMADPMAGLADALEAARCTESDILAHCRGSGPHVQGCWAVDLILGKK